MARRIVISCEHDRTEPHPLPGAVPVHILGSAGMAYNDVDMCEGGRVLDPGSYVLIEKVDGEWPKWALLRLVRAIPQSRNMSPILDALAGGEQP